MASVEVQNLREIYQRDSQEIVVLDGMNLQVPDGEFVALMGPSGSGKTTLLNCIAGIDRPTSGALTVGGTDVTSLQRNWIRTASTLAGLALCIFLICVLETVLDAIRTTTQDADPSRLITRHAVSLNLRLPRSYYETIKDSAGPYASAGTFNVQIANPSQAGAVMRAIDANFENSDVQTKTETEGAFLAEFIKLTGNLTSLLNTVGMAVAFAILLITANTMSMAVRERRTEIAVLKTLGFSGGLVMTLVQVEALALGSIGGLVGIGLAQATVGYLADLPFMGFILGNLTGLSVSPLVAAITFSLAVGLGAAAGFVPAFGAYRARITDMLRQA